MAWDQLKNSNALTLFVKVIKLQRKLIELRTKQQAVRAMQQLHLFAGKKDGLGKATNR